MTEYRGTPVAPGAVRYEQSSAGMQAAWLTGKM